MSQPCLEQMQDKALVLEAYHTPHIEGTQLTLHESKKLWQGQYLSDVNPDDVRELLTYRKAFELGRLPEGDADKSQTRRWIV